jgi:Na+-translocating ferredoxin:NAD+ oxidoreductase RnfE subunit
MGEKLGAGLEFRIEELLGFITLAVMLRIFRSEKGALMMVKPPGYFRRSGIFEVHDSVLVAVKIGFIKESARAMDQAGELKLRV